MTMSPSRAFPIGMVIAALFMGWVGTTAARLADETPLFSWICWISAAALVVTALRTLFNVRQLELEITREAVRLGDRRVAREAVTKVHRHKGALFKGVRVENAVGAPLDISATHHNADEVLKILFKEDYPVDQL